jgi:hypothetical protein
MLFPWQRVRGGLVAHNGPPRTTGGVFSATVPTRSAGPVRVTVEPFTPWLAALARTGWTPVGPAPVVAADPPGPCGPHLRPAVLKASGGNPRDAWVLAWLLYVRAGRASPAEAPPVEHRDGEMYVVAARGRVAAATGLSSQQVADGLAALAARGLIEVVAAAGRPSLVRVDVPAVNRAAAG